MLVTLADTTLEDTTTRPRARTLADVRDVLSGLIETDASPSYSWCHTEYKIY
jgi:hypothetical protein